MGDGFSLAGQSIIEAKFIQMPGDAHQIGKHRIADGGSDHRIGERVQPDA